MDFESLPCPMKAIGANPTMPYAFMPSLDFSAIVQFDDDFVPETTHLLLLENAEMCAALCLAFLAQHGWA